MAMVDFNSGCGMTELAGHKSGSVGKGKAAVLCIEDDPIVQLMLDDIVDGAGATCILVGTAREAEHKLENDRYGLVVLDRRLPDSDGLLLMQNIKDSSNCPVIILSAMGDARDKLLGIGLGAAEYVTKPFNPLELSSRIRQLLRVRSRVEKGKSSFEFGGMKFDVRSRQLEIDGQSHIIAPAESRLLQTLLSNANEVQTRDQLSQATSGHDWIPGDRTIDVLINRLRRHLKSAGVEIRTVHRTGYLLSTKTADSI